VRYGYELEWYTEEMPSVFALSMGHDGDGEGLTFIYGQRNYSTTYLVKSKGCSWTLPLGLQITS
jgi:hypothetical protein